MVKNSGFNEFEDVMFDDFRSTRGLDDIFADDDDFDFCEDDGCGSDCGCNDKCHCHDKCEDKCEDKCHCHDNCEDNCQCNDCCEDNCCNWDDCCDDPCNHSGNCDYNEDERYGCRRSDAANSDDGWFEERECNSCYQDRCMSAAQCKFCKKLKCRIQVLEFALHETILYLNTHPCDCEALRYYYKIKCSLDKAERIYNRRCGPLTNKDVNTEYGWEWAQSKWPWEGE